METCEAGAPTAVVSWLAVGTGWGGLVRGEDRGWGTQGVGVRYLLSHPLLYPSASRGDYVLPPVLPSHWPLLLLRLTSLEGLGTRWVGMGTLMTPNKETHSTCVALALLSGGVGWAVPAWWGRSHCQGCVPTSLFRFQAYIRGFYNTLTLL